MQSIHPDEKKWETDCRAQRPASPASGAKDAPLGHPWLVEKAPTMETPGVRLGQVEHGWRRQEGS
jgi:hypothetical protein